MLKRITIFFALTIPLMAINLNSVSFGLKTTKYDYTEVDTSGTILDTEEANLGRIQGLYTKAQFSLEKSSSYFEFMYSFTAGSTKYIGALLSGGTYGSYVSKTNNVFKKTEFSYVKRLNGSAKKAQSSKFGTLSFVPAVGYHYWERTLSATQNEIYTWFYYQLGIRSEIKSSKRDTFLLQYSHQWAYRPQMYADIPSIGLNDDFNLGKTESDFVTLGFKRKISNNTDMEINLEYETVDIGRSNVIKNFVEPQSYQKNLSVYLGFVFRVIK